MPAETLAMAGGCREGAGALRTPRTRRDPVPGTSASGPPGDLQGPAGARLAAHFRQVRRGLVRGRGGLRRGRGRGAGGGCGEVDRLPEAAHAEDVDPGHQQGSGLRSLVSRDPVRGDKVAIIGDNRPEWLFSELAAQCAGAIGIRSSHDSILT